MSTTPESSEDHLWKALCQSQPLDLVGEITGGMVHDLNNGLSIVNGLAELLMERLGADEDAASEPSPVAAEELLDLARRDLSRILTWTGTTMANAHRLLDYAHRLRDDSGEVDVNALCAAAVDESRYRCDRDGIQMRLDLADDLPHVNGHAGQLLQVLANVLRNSREAWGRMAGGGEALKIIRMSTRREDDSVTVCIEDNGPGLPPGVGEDRVFELAYSTKTEDAAACGSGLPVARMIARRHGGDLRLAQCARGTRMVLELPAAT